MLHGLLLDQKGKFFIERINHSTPDEVRDIHLLNLLGECYTLYSSGSEPTEVSSLSSKAVWYCWLWRLGSLYEQLYNLCKQSSSKRLVAVVKN